jgi:hypothetical protein
MSRSSARVVVILGSTYEVVAATFAVWHVPSIVVPETDVPVNSET